MRGLHTDIRHVEDGEWQIVASRSLVPLPPRAEPRRPTAAASDPNASLAFDPMR